MLSSVQDLPVDSHLVLVVVSPQVASHISRVRPPLQVDLAPSVHTQQVGQGGLGQVERILIGRVDVFGPPQGPGSTEVARKLLVVDLLVLSSPSLSASNRQAILLQPLAEAHERATKSDALCSPALAAAIDLAEIHGPAVVEGPGCGGEAVGIRQPLAGGVLGVCAHLHVVRGPQIFIQDGAPGIRGGLEASPGPSPFLAAKLRVRTKPLSVTLALVLQLVPAQGLVVAVVGDSLRASARTSQLFAALCAAEVLLVASACLRGAHGRRIGGALKALPMATLHAAPVLHVLPVFAERLAQGLEVGCQEGAALHLLRLVFHHIDSARRANRAGGLQPDVPAAPGSQRAAHHVEGLQVIAVLHIVAAVRLATLRAGSNPVEYVLVVAVRRDECAVLATLVVLVQIASGQHAVA
mmetsp:Transcript_94910/g.225989  ORF Transcript_94910/g.225989 Transcript_94910/m.225989 type:complete len:410 (+) Transcript_94910:4668-5897(+)